MMWNLESSWGRPVFMPVFMRENMGLILALVVLEVVLKGFALWRAARRNEQYWFVALLVLNTAGLLPALYLLFFSGSKKKS